MPQMIVIVKCDAVAKRCVGANCMHAFYNREGTFRDVPDGALCLTTTCGGCCGSSLPAKLENLEQRLAKFGVAKEDVTVHLASCVVSENHHRTPCPFRGYMRQLIGRKGFKTVLGTYISKKAEAKRQAGEYRKWE